VASDAEVSIMKFVQALVKEKASHVTAATNLKRQSVQVDHRGEAG
jgi:hypothetical protein